MWVKFSRWPSTCWSIFITKPIEQASVDGSNDLTDKCSIVTYWLRLQIPSGGNNSDYSRPSLPSYMSIFPPQSSYQTINFLEVVPVARHLGHCPLDLWKYHICKRFPQRLSPSSPKTVELCLKTCLSRSPVVSGNPVVHSSPSSRCVVSCSTKLPIADKTMGKRNHIVINWLLF